MNYNSKNKQERQIKHLSWIMKDYPIWTGECDILMEWLHEEIYTYSFLHVWTGDLRDKEIGAINTFPLCSKSLKKQPNNYV